MARLAETKIGVLPPFVKAEEVSGWDDFSIVNATERPSNLEQDRTEVVFTLRFDRTLFTMTMATNVVRHQFVEHFKNGGDPITNLRLVKGDKPVKGNAAWIFQDNGGESPDLEYVEDDSYQGNSNDIPF